MLERPDGLGLQSVACGRPSRWPTIETRPRSQQCMQHTYEAHQSGSCDPLIKPQGRQKRADVELVLLTARTQLFINSKGDDNMRVAK